MIPRGGWRASLVATASLLLSVPLFAANTRLERVLLLPAVDRSSVVFELTAEPRQVSTRRISDSVFELEAGPDVDSVAPQMLKAPANVRFIDSVTVRVLPTPAGSVVRARIVMTIAAQAMVRSVGRRVYVDISQAPALPATPAPSAQAAQAGRGSGSRPAAAAAKPEDAYRSAVRPVVAKLKELGPFLASAASSGDSGVSAAVLPNLLTVRGSLAALQPPDQARGSHTMVLGAVDRIIKALSPEFTGDRATAVKQSNTTIEVVGGVLAGD
jgi:hypothetical protein